FYYLCLAQVGSPPPLMRGFIDYACGVNDCGHIQLDGLCFKPNIVYEHASFALNQEYRPTGICTSLFYVSRSQPIKGLNLIQSRGPLAHSSLLSFILIYYMHYVYEHNM
ncbi:glucan endo-1,3-beta-glucosidase-like protein 3, partial [Dorcoceras hygrometricum]